MRSSLGAWAGHKPAFVLGNVLGSRCSVLTSFKSQILNGGPVTVTHPDIARYFMTIPEAVQLVIKAAAIGTGGETLVLDMGQPVRIADVARQLIKQSDRSVAIRYTGLRIGEKSHEDLYSGCEEQLPTSHPMIPQVSVEPISVTGARRAIVAGEPQEVRNALVQVPSCKWFLSPLSREPLRALPTCKDPRGVADHRGVRLNVLVPLCPHTSPVVDAQWGVGSALSKDCSSPYVGMVAIAKDHSSQSILKKSSEMHGTPVTVSTAGSV